MKIKLSDVMTYEEFLERYLVNKEEFIFYYNDKIINICYGTKGTFSYNIIENDVLIFEKEFTTPKELLDNMEIDNIKFPELWNVLE